MATLRRPRRRTPVKECIRLPWYISVEPCDHYIVYHVCCGSRILAEMESMTIARQIVRAHHNSLTAYPTRSLT